METNNVAAVAMLLIEKETLLSKLKGMQAITHFIQLEEGSKMLCTDMYMESEQTKVLLDNSVPFLETVRYNMLMAGMNTIVARLKEIDDLLIEAETMLQGLL